MVRAEQKFIEVQALHLHNNDPHKHPIYFHSWASEAQHKARELCFEWRRHCVEEARSRFASFYLALLHLCRPSTERTLYQVTGNRYVRSSHFGLSQAWPSSRVLSPLKWTPVPDWPVFFIRRFAVCSSATAQLKNHLIIQFRFVKIRSMRTIVFYEQHIGLWILRLFLKIKKKMLRFYQNESHHITITANREETPIV